MPMYNIRISWISYYRVVIGYSEGGRLSKNLLVY